jgi:hypothetical protein
LDQGFVPFSCRESVSLANYVNRECKVDSISSLSLEHESDRLPPIGSNSPPQAIISLTTCSGQVVELPHWFFCSLLQCRCNNRKKTAVERLITRDIADDKSLAAIQMN